MIKALEYWAEGVQSYFSVNVERAYTDSVHNGINTRKELKDYDPDMHDLIQSIFPCQNVLVSRCHDFWQGRSSSASIFYNHFQNHRISPNPTRFQSNFSERSMKQLLRVNYPSCVLENKAKELRAEPQKQAKSSTVKDVIYIFVYVGISVVLYCVTRAIINKNRTEST